MRLANQGKPLRHNLIDMPPTGPWILADGRPAQTSNYFLDLNFNESLLDGLVYFGLPDRKMNLVGKDGMFPGFASWFLYDPDPHRCCSGDECGIKIYRSHAASGTCAGSATEDKTDCAEITLKCDSPNKPAD